MTRVVEGVAIDRHVLNEEWTVLVAEQVLGVADVRTVDDGGQVFVADLPETGTGGTSGNSFASALCGPGGSVQVTTRNAPPALLVTSAGHRAVPDGVAHHETVTLDPGDRLILLSASALEGLPCCLARVLHEPPDRLLRADESALLVEVFDQQQSGAGAVVVRSATRNPRHEESA